MKFWILVVCFIVHSCEASKIDGNEDEENIDEPVHIIGGTNAGKTSWPWQVRIKYKGRFQCGGTLISNDTVLTAAHCIGSKRGKHYQAIVGDYNAKKNEKKTRGEKKMKVSKVVKHPGYKNRELSNDIAILKLTEPITPSVYIQSIPRLATPNDTFINATCYSTGWGVYKGKKLNKYPKILQELQVTVISNADCSNRIDGIEDDMICTDDEPKNTCFGDSGGPLQCMVGGEWVHAGLTSWGDEDCRVGPSVNARTSYFLQWIKDNM